MHSIRSRFITAIGTALLVGACATSASPNPASPSAPATPSGSNGTPSATPVPAPPSVGATPSPTSPPALPEIASIAAGGLHTCAVTSGGGVKCWGSNDSGQLGDGTTTDSNVPVDALGFEGGVTAVAAGNSYTCVLRTASGVTCWGARIGHAEPSAGSAFDVPGLASGVTALTAGSGHACALTNGGGVLCWGSNDYGQLGNDTMTDSPIPRAVSGLASGVRSIDAGDIHTCAVTTGGGVKCWGYMGSGGLGKNVPADVPGLASDVSAIATNYEETCALTTGGEVKCWNGFQGNVPTQVDGLGSDIRAIDAGFSHTCALTRAGDVTCWDGPDGSGPTGIAGLENGVMTIAGGGSHTCAVLHGGVVRCWGDNWDGQLGNGQPCSTWSGSSDPVDVDFASTPGGEPTAPVGTIEHATGSTDVLLRFDRGPDVGLGELEGELFQPGPEFTLFGDGTVIFRNESAPAPVSQQGILRARPFMVADLAEADVRSLLRFAIGEGGLGDACESYPTRDTDVVSVDILTIRAGGLDKRIENVGSAPFESLYDLFLDFGSGGEPSTKVWVANRYWGHAIELDPENLASQVEIGLLPDPAIDGTFAWPWPGITPASFFAADGRTQRRGLTAGEAAVIGLSDKGGVVQRVYLRGPDRKTLYYFSLWPRLPDEAS